MAMVVSTGVRRRVSQATASAPANPHSTTGIPSQSAAFW